MYASSHWNTPLGTADHWYFTGDKHYFVELSFMPIGCLMLDEHD